MCPGTIERPRPSRVGGVLLCTLTLLQICSRVLPLPGQHPTEEQVSNAVENCTPSSAATPYDHPTPAPFVAPRGTREAAAQSMLWVETRRAPGS